jgi:hypothetical protein
LEHWLKALPLRVAKGGLASFLPCGKKGPRDLGPHPDRAFSSVFGCAAILPFVATAESTRWQL